MPGQQQIPRPEDSRPGGPGPWESVPHERRRGITISRIRKALESVGPTDTFPALPYDASPAAVLVPLFEEDGETRVVLTRRSSRMRYHTGEVSFPGGRLEEGEVAVAGALREAAEEIGLDPATVEIIGELPPLATFSSKSGITPFVGALPARPELDPNPHEVEHVFDVALVELMSTRVYHEEVWPMFGAERPMHFFELPDDTVWGATARMLHEFLELIVLAPPD